MMVEIVNKIFLRAGYHLFFKPEILESQQLSPDPSFPKSARRMASWLAAG
jgi:hypothetical protein